MDKLMGFLGRNFFYYPEDQTGDSRRYALYPALNVDRDGPGTPETLQRYLEYEEQLYALVDALLEAYVACRQSMKTLACL